MRLNIYYEEITHQIEVIEKTADTGKSFLGLRIHLKSLPEIHQTEDDDDTSAVTFWFDSMASLNDFRNALYVNAQSSTRMP